jgi:excisionase family DNA binding protein
MEGPVAALGSMVQRGREVTGDDREVMTVTQAAAYLQINVDTLYKYATANLISAFKLGNRWRFKKSLLDKWMDEQANKNVQVTS